MLYGSSYQHFYSFGKGYLFNLFFVVRNNAVQYRTSVKWSLNLGNSVLPVYYATKSLRSDSAKMHQVCTAHSADLERYTDRLSIVG